MIVRIYWAKVQSGAWPSIEQKYGELNMIATPGFLGRLVTQDVNDPESMFTLTFWDDLESVRAWEASAEFKNVFVPAIEPYIVGSHSISFCDVKLESLAGLLARAGGEKDR
jgi:heme-degrading monooxygenase HmoA